MTNAVEFVRQVRQEASRVTWSSRKEVVTTTAVVLVMIFIASLFFLLVDGIIFSTTQMIMGF